MDRFAPDRGAPRTRYLAPEQLRHAPPTYPGSWVGRLLDDRDPGAELYAALIAVEREVPPHFHPVFELQYVLSGSGLALDADGLETAIAPGGAVLSPAGMAGAHGFRSTGSLPLTMLCVFPAPDGTPPARWPYLPSAEPLVGPRTRYLAPEQLRHAPPTYPGSWVGRLLDDRDPGAELYAALIAVEREVPPHFHPVFELQYVLSGSGLALDADGLETAIAPGGAVLSPAGMAGAHGFRSTGSLPLTMLCVFPAPDGTPPARWPYLPSAEPLVGPRTRSARSYLGRPAKGNSGG